MLRDDSPPANSNGIITDAECKSGAWTCDHRNRGIVAMVKWHSYVGAAKRANFYTDDANVIAFSKDSKGWAAFNIGTSAKQIHVQTGLPEGTYCDVIHDKDSARPAGPTVVVSSTGFATITVKATDTVAFTRADRISSMNYPCRATPDTIMRRHDHTSGGLAVMALDDRGPVATCMEESQRNAGGFPSGVLLLDEAPNYAVRIRARAARRFNARRSSSLRPPQTP